MTKPKNFPIAEEDLPPRPWLLDTDWGVAFQQAMIRHGVLKLIRDADGRTIYQMKMSHDDREIVAACVEEANRVTAAKRRQ